MIRVMIVDDHEVVRLGLRTALELEDDLEVVGDAASAADALEKARSLRPHVVLLDVVMPEVGGVETCRELRDLPEPPRVVMLTSYNDEQAVSASVLAGAAGYLLKNVSRVDIVRAIRAVAAGESLLDPAVVRAATRKMAERAAPADDGLTEREREILDQVAQGKTNKQIAADLFISEKTARNHVSRILEKLGMARRSQAAAYAAQQAAKRSESPKSGS